MDNNFPDDLLLQIFIHLPVVYLLRARCVCKSWYSLINTSSFILQHFLHNQATSNYKVLLRRYLPKPKQEIYTLHSDDQHFHTLETLHFPLNCSSSDNYDNQEFQANEPLESRFNTLPDYFTIIGCVNGLICLLDERLSTLILWNPAIRKWLTLPKFEFETLNKELEPRKKGTFTMRCGFGFDVLSHDFKVVNVTFYRKTVDGESATLETAVGIFSLRSKSWRRLDSSDHELVFSKQLEYCSSSCNVGSFVYWLAFVDDFGQADIVSFNLSSEMFSKISFPEDIFRCYDLANFRDSLALIAPLYSWDGLLNQIWVMREDGVVRSWTKLFTVNIIKGSSRSHLVGFSKRGLRLIFGEGGFRVEEDAQVVSYKPYGFQSSWHVESYKESLFLLGDGDGDNLPVSTPNFGNDKKGEAETMSNNLVQKFTASHQIGLEGINCGEGTSGTSSFRQNCGIIGLNLFLGFFILFYLTYNTK